MIDELEKALAYGGGSEADAGLSRRILGRLLGWLQDRAAPVFVARAADGFSGAEIEQAVVSALYTAFSHGSDLTTALLVDELRATRPLSVVRKEEIDRLRAWAHGRTVSAG